MILKGFIFDLDGVVTDTAQAHASAWKALFDEYLSKRHNSHGEPFIEFGINTDYLDYVDGKPRYEGVRAFLDSRNIQLPFGDPTDGPDQETICGLGNKKNYLFKKVIEEKGVKVYKTSVQWIHQLKSQGIKVAMATSSKNGPLILKKAGLDNLFEATVDGNVSAKLELKGKPFGDIFVEAARRLNLKPSVCAVIEDAISGVQAGKEGKFLLVIGVARTNPKTALLRNGADIAVKDLGELLGKNPDDLIP